MAEVLIIGRGAREHALAKQFAASPQVTQVYVAPGNPGMTGARIECLPLSETDFSNLIDFAQDHAGMLTFVGPEVPLGHGIVDAFQQAGLLIFGPTKKAAQLETSKEFAKKMMQEAGVPTANYCAFTQEADALDYAREQSYPLVIKADGLAAGKGVVIAPDFASAEASLHALLGEQRFDTQSVVIEEFLAGQEFSSMALIDGERVVMLPPSQDHKAAYDGDQGPNTGGMGAYSPLPQLPADLNPEVRQRVIEPLLQTLAKHGMTYTGVLYVGMILTASGLRVIEFNVRFGDPETSVLLPRLRGDFYQLILGVLGRAPLAKLDVRPEAAVCVVVSSAEYPQGSGSGVNLAVFRDLPEDLAVDFAGVKSGAVGLESDGGRVLCLKTLAPTVAEAQARLYRWLDAQAISGLRYRHDIGHRALQS